MIIYTEKGYGLHKEIAEKGYSLVQRSGEWISSDDVAVQAIIDSFNPLPLLQKEYVDLVNDIAGETRIKYVTNVPFQEAAYQMKEADTRRYKADGYPNGLATSQSSCSKLYCTIRANLNVRQIPTR